MKANRTTWNVGHVIHYVQNVPTRLQSLSLNETLWYILIISSMTWIFLAIELTLHFDEQMFMLVIGVMFVHLALVFLTSRIK